MRIFKHILILLMSISAFSQSEIFCSKINLKDTDLENFYSTIKIDSNRVYFNANNFSMYTYDKNTKQLIWESYAGYKSNDNIICNANNVFKIISEVRLNQLQAITGDTIQTLKIQELSTQPLFKDNLMFCVAVVPEIGGAVLAYDLKKNEIVWQKYIGHGTINQPLFFKNKIVVNFENQYWFELDYNGNAIDKNENCYKKNNESPFEEKFCEINYDLMSQDFNDVATKNVNINGINYYFTQNATLFLNENQLKVIDKNSIIKSEIELDKIIITPTDISNKYTEILKVEDQTVWFMCHNTLVVYNFITNNKLKTFDLSKWNPHKVILEKDKVWLISKIDGQLYNLDLKGQIDRKVIQSTATPTISGRIKYLNQIFYNVINNYTTPKGFPKMIYKDVQVYDDNFQVKIMTSVSNNDTYIKKEGYQERNLEQLFNPEDIISITQENKSPNETLSAIIIQLKPYAGTTIEMNGKYEKLNKSKKLKWIEKTKKNISNEIRIEFLETKPDSFLEIKKAFEDLKQLYKNY